MKNSIIIISIYLLGFFSGIAFVTVTQQAENSFVSPSKEEVKQSSHTTFKAVILLEAVL